MKNLYLSEDEKNKILKLHKSFLLKEDGGTTTDIGTNYTPEPKVGQPAQQNTENITIQKLQTKLGVGSDGKLGPRTLGVIQQKLGITATAPSSTTTKPGTTTNTTANATTTDKANATTTDKANATTTDKAKDETLSQGKTEITPNPNGAPSVVPNAGDTSTIDASSVLSRYN